MSVIVLSGGNAAVTLQGGGGTGVVGVPSPVARGTYNAADFPGATTEIRVNAMCAKCTADGVKLGYIPASMLPYDVTLLTNLAAFSAAGGRLVREGGNPAVYDIQAYGAARSGADATASIQAAMDAANAAGGGIVSGAAGTFNYTTLRYYSLVTLQGAGVTAGGVAVTVFYQASAAAPLLQPNDPSVGTKGFCIRDISFSSFGNANNTGGLDFTGCSLFDVDRVHVSGCNNFGVRVVGIAPAGYSGFGNFSRVVIQSLRTGARAWDFGSNTTLDQPDGLNFWGCYTNVASDVTVIRSTGPVGGHGPGSHLWTGCRFELGSSGTQLVLDVDAQGYGADFVGCRFETFGANQTYNLVGVTYSGGIAFYRTTMAASGGVITTNDTGAIPTQWIACGVGVGGVGRVATLLNGLTVRAQTVTANVTLNGFTTVTFVDATSGPATVSLPDPTLVPGSVWFRIVKSDASANAVTINAGSKTINGVATKVLHQQYQGVDVVSDGTNWFSVAAHGIALGDMELKPFSALRWGDGGSGNGYVQIDGTPQLNISLNGTVQMRMTVNAFVPIGNKDTGTTAAPFRNAFYNSAAMVGQTTPAAGTSFTPSLLAGNCFKFPANANPTINAPTNAPAAGQTNIFAITVQNTTAGAITTTWNAAYHLAGAWVEPAAAKQRTIWFFYDQPTGLSYEVARSAADVTT